MFDIFNQKEQPKLYIADIWIDYKIPSRSKKVMYEVYSMHLKDHPIVLIDGEFPTEKTKQSFFKKIYHDKISKGEFDKIKFSIASISNIRFSSNLMYEFDYDNH